MSADTREQHAAEVTACVARYFDEWGYSPSVREITNALSLSSTSVAAYWVRAASDLGYLEKPHVLRPRALRVTPKGREAIVGIEARL